MIERVLYMEDNTGQLTLTECLSEFGKMRWKKVLQIQNTLKKVLQMHCIHFHFEKKIFQLQITLYTFSYFKYIVTIFCITLYFI